MFGAMQVVAIDSPIARRVVRRNEAQIRFCYEQALRAKPDLAGTLRLTITIDADGKVTDATTTRFEPSVDACIAHRAKSWAFPKLANGDKAIVIAPISFSPSDRITATLPSQRIGGEPPPSPVIVAYGAAKVTGKLDANRARAAITQEIRGHEYCFVLVDSLTPEGLPNATGTLAAEIDGTGALTSSTITGLDMRLAACLHRRIPSRFMAPADKQPAGISIQVTFKKRPSKK